MNKAIVDNFYQLDPNCVLISLEEAGFMPTGRYWQLNSYENRVFDIELEKVNLKPDRVVAKFYRPNRWSREAIQEEHQFLDDLRQEGISAVNPLVLSNGQTIMETNGIFFSVFPKVMGRSPQEFIAGELAQVGRTLAKIHNVGAQTKAKHRPTWEMPARGQDSLEVLEFRVPQGIWQRYLDASLRIFDDLEKKLKPESFLRIHGDCHKGNLLHNGQEFFFVDFDDFGMGPAAQDFWMLFSGDSENEAEEREEILAGYSELRDFNVGDFKLMNALRGLRIVNYGAWIANRWDDPSFPRLFPNFESYNYWAEEVEALEKIAWSL